MCEAVAPVQHRRLHGHNYMRSADDERKIDFSDISFELLESARGRVVLVTAFLMQLVFPLEKAHMGGKVVLSAWSHAIPIYSQAIIGLNLRQ